MPTNNHSSDSIVSGNQSPTSQPVIFESPLDKAKERVTKKPFGIFITPQNSPVSPEKFSGYHTGVDFEIFPQELNLDVLVKAIWKVKIILIKYATGYGGVLVQSCQLDSISITVIYGHLKLDSIIKLTGDNLEAGENLGILGANNSVETNGERKHLHLGIHKDSAINILGYVQNKGELDNWIDPCLYICD
jgi:hypothetical protein